MQSIHSGDSMPGHDQPVSFKRVNIGFAWQLAKDVNLTLLGVKNFSDLIAGQDVPYQTAPAPEFPGIISQGSRVCSVSVAMMTGYLLPFVSFLNSYFPIAV